MSKIVKFIHTFSGILAPVANLGFVLKDDKLSIFWNVPFSLNLTNDNKSFCVELFNHGIDEPLISECGVYSSNYSLDVSQINLLCGDYSVRVIAVNVTGNSTPSTVRIWNRGNFMSYF